MSRPKDLVVIAGGGMAQVESAIGCLWALEDRGVDLHSPELEWRVTSAGSLVASLIACGAFTARACVNYLAGIETGDLIYRRWFWPFRILFGGASYDRTGVERLVKKRLGDRVLANVTVLATRAKTMQRAEFPASVSTVLASFAIDGVFPHVRIDGEYFLDGGYVDNVPLEPWRMAKFSTVYLILPPKDIEHDRHAKTAIGRLLRSFDAKIGQETEEADYIYTREYYPNLVKLRPPPARTSLLALSPARELIRHAHDYAERALA